MCKMETKKLALDLQVHLYLEKYHPEKVINAMQKNNINGIAVQTYNDDKNVFSELLSYKKDLINRGYEVENDSILMKITDKRTNKQTFMFNSYEVSTSDDFHLLIFGYHVKHNQPIRETIDEALNKGAFVGIDHPFVNINGFYKSISDEKVKDLEKICKEYSGNIALEWNGYCIRWVWDKILKPINIIISGYGVNPNKAVLDLSAKFKKEDHPIPVFTSTDTHVRNELALKAIGTSKIEILKNYLDLNSGTKFIYSLNDCIFNEKHENTYETVDVIHLGFYFALPQLFNKFYERVRG